MASHRVVGWLAVCLATAAGCTQAPWRPGVTAPRVPLVSVAGANPAVPATVTAPAMPSFSNPDPRDLQTQLARSREENRIAQEELAAVRDQLKATTMQLAESRAVARPEGPAGVPGDSAVVPQPVIAPASMREGMSQLAIPGATARLDGGVVRIELPADKLFEPGTAGLLPAGAALLSQAAAEVQRVFAGQFVGIEGHTDTEPLQNATWGSPHQLSVARASAVFEFLSARTTLDAKQLFVVAHGSNHPVVSNATAAGRTRNRRIELVVYPEQATPERGDAAAAPDPGG